MLEFWSLKSRVSPCSMQFIPIAKRIGSPVHKTPTFNRGFLLMYYTYILISETTGKVYIGQTNNPEARIIRHNSNKNFTTVFIVMQFLIL